MSWLDEILERGRDLLDRLGDSVSEFATDIRDRIDELFFNAETIEEIEEEQEAENEEIEEEEEIETEADDTELWYEEVLSEIEEAQRRADEYLQSVDNYNEAETEYPENIPTETIEQIFNDLGVITWDDLTDEEKEFYHPEPDIPTDEQYASIDQLAQDLGIPLETAQEIGLDELIEIATRFDDRLSIAREFMDIDFDQSQAAEDLEMKFRGSFDSWEDFYNSEFYDFFIKSVYIKIDAYIDQDGEIHIDVYEEENT